VHYKPIIPVSEEPITLEEALDHIRNTGGSADAEGGIALSLISTAREWCEEFTGLSFAPQTIELYLPSFPHKSYIEIPRPPLVSVTSVKYKNSAGVETTMTPTTDYIVDADSLVGSVVLPYGKTWPSFVPYPVNAVKIVYTAGYGEANPLPRTLRQAMLLLIGHWFNHREAVGTVDKEIEFSVHSLLWLWRVRWFE